MHSPEFHRLRRFEEWRIDRRANLTPRRKVIWTIGNLLILTGMLLLLFVGGLYSDEQYSVYAASGSTDVTIPVREMSTPSASTQPRQAVSAAPAVPRQVAIPLLNEAPGSQLSNVLPAQSVLNYGPSTLSRIVVPAIGLDRKVVEVHWTVETIDGQEVAVWDVDKYRVGHHQGTANPGQGGNIVLAGHSGGEAYPFNEIYWLKPGDQIELYSNGVLFNYVVSEHILVDEVGQPLEKRLDNARWIEPTDSEAITMVACWPLTGPNKFNQRVIIRSVPADVAPETVTAPISTWRIR